MLFELDEDFGYAEKILDKIIKLTTDNGCPILPSTKNVKSQKCYVKACEMLWSIYDGTFFKQYHITERSDYNMSGWKDKIRECEDDWSKIHSLVLSSVKHFKQMFGWEYSPVNKKYLASIKFSNFFETGLNQSMFVNCINEPLLCGAYLRSKKVTAIKSNIPDDNLNYAEKFYNQFIKDSDYESVYWKGISDISNWWKLFKKYTSFGFDVSGNFKNSNIICDYCNFIKEYIEKSGKDCNPYWFKIYNDSDDILCDGFFRSYVTSNKFAVCKDLPRKIWFYGNENKFKTLVKKEKSIITIDDETSFIDNLEG